MKRLVLILGVFLLMVVAMIVGSQLVEHKGYVLIRLGDMSFETSFLTLLILIFGSVVLFLIGLSVSKRLLRITLGSKYWLGSFSQRRLSKAYFKGMTAYFEGDLNRADRWLQRTRSGDFDGVNLLAAGQVAADLGDRDRAEKYWLEAADESNADYAAKVCIAKSHLANNEAGKALEIIEALSEEEQKRISIVNLWITILAHLGRWQEIQQRLPQWRKPLGDAYSSWAKQASKGEFAEIASRSGANELIQHWHQLPRASRKDRAKQAAYVQQLLDQGMHNEAQKHLVEWQGAGPVEELLPLMKELRLPNPAPAVKLLEHWLKQDENNVEYLTVLGAIAMNCGNDILAEKVLQKAIKLEPTQERLRMLAQISERQQDNVRALALYKQSVE
ncbi:heme biosynthesis HemY N-terminal domain-containing protein [Alteromonas sp. ASW11-36]|uniref:Heme biosynthesis HemY N-terminal domain-containing protein n=1 Tax=Alteromonas arenosi TaxID=3055817 RepID=A0ABT7SSN6_9ALTE|nr:heme biosynthesis HemY N-terminal domain-containing protein [Alteromonas sp. ASW11-36]MDM7859210.1 heme biosynthesis HemY N-terminal domain-containing protein [Alteromonas sp. ASW11-36]